MDSWTEHYTLLTNRNIGILTPAQQEIIRQSKVAVAGLGGIGGPVAEMLCRMGVGRLSILDHGTFEPTNLNRQIHAYTDTDNRLKTKVTEEFLRRINPEAEIERFEAVTSKNAPEFLEDANAVVLGIDSVKPCIVLSRAARRMKIPLIEGWAVAAGNVRVYTHETPTLEEVYRMPTAGREAEELSSVEERELLIHSLNVVQEQISGLSGMYPPLAMQRREEKGEGTTLAPLVWLTCTLMAIETTKVLLNWGKLALAPGFATYNPIDHRIMDN